MKKHTNTLALLTLFCAALVSCTSTGDADTQETSIDSGPPSPLVQHAWTTEFEQPTLLFADRVYIEGPRGLLDHFAARAVEEYHSYEAETVPDGFRQTYKVVRPTAGVELRAYLDALELVVMNDLVVIERPGELDVVVRATGNVYWRNSSTGEEHRASQLNFTGVIEAPGDDSAAQADTAPAADQ